MHTIQTLQLIHKQSCPSLYHYQNTTRLPTLNQRLIVAFIATQVPCSHLALHTICTLQLIQSQCTNRYTQASTITKYHQIAHIESKVDCYMILDLEISKNYNFHARMPYFSAFWVPPSPTISLNGTSNSKLHTQCLFARFRWATAPSGDP